MASKLVLFFVSPTRSLNFLVLLHTLSSHREMLDLSNIPDGLIPEDYEQQFFALLKPFRIDLQAVTFNNSRASGFIDVASHVGLKKKGKTGRRSEGEFFKLYGRRSHFFRLGCESPLIFCFSGMEGTPRKWGDRRMSIWVTTSQR
jgi:hypothetical protein